METEVSDPDSNIIENIISASKGAEFYLSEDVYDQAGNKLLAKGYKITSDIKDKLISRVLKKPLETSITTDTSLTAADIASDTNEIIKKTHFLNSFEVELKLDLYAIKHLELEPLASLLLTVQKNNSQASYEHTLFMMLVARLIAKKLNIDSQKINDLTTACLLHDIGELYCVVPETKNLSLEHWRSIMTHPIVGSSVVRQHMNYNTSISKAILEHHERNDGSGYPNHLIAENLSDIGKIMIVSEAFSGMVKRQYDISNLTSTLKLINHDFPKAELNALIGLLQTLSGNSSHINTNPILENLVEKLSNLESIIEQLNSIKSENDKLDLFKDYLNLRLKRICQTVYASGLTDCKNLGIWDSIKLDEDINRELYVTTNEVEWKMKDLYRDISIRIFRDGLQISDDLQIIIDKINIAEEIA